MNMEFSTRDIPFERCVIKARFETQPDERFGMTRLIIGMQWELSLVYDVTDQDSFEHLKEIWLKQLRDFAHEKIQVMLVGNKADGNMTPGARKVTQKNSLRKELGIVSPTSAFDGEVEPTFQMHSLSRPVIPVPPFTRPHRTSEWLDRCHTSNGESSHSDRQQHTSQGQGQELHDCER